jgi:hypothetical protein
MTRPAHRPVRTQKIPQGFDPLRRLAAAVVVNALEDYLFPRQTTRPATQKEAFVYLVEGEGSHLLAELNIPVTWIGRLKRDDLKRYWDRITAQ